MSDLNMCSEPNYTIVCKTIKHYDVTMHIWHVVMLVDRAVIDV